MGYLKASQLAFLLFCSLYSGVLSFCCRTYLQYLPLQDLFAGGGGLSFPWASTWIAWHPATVSCVSAAWEVHQPTSDELQKHGNEEGGAAHGAWCLHWVPASKAGERREESNYRYLLGNQLIKIQNKVQLESCMGSWCWWYSVVGCIWEQFQKGHLSKHLSIPDSHFLEIQPPEKNIWYMAHTCLVAMCALENLWAEQVW